MNLASDLFSGGVEIYKETKLFSKAFKLVKFGILLIKKLQQQLPNRNLLNVKRGVYCVTFIAIEVFKTSISQKVLPSNVIKYS